MSHTPGPWHLSNERFGKGKWEIKSSTSGEFVCSIWGKSEEAVEDGNLIAAAPDLLEACKTFMEPCPACDYGVRTNCNCLQAIDKAKAAIAKAEGKVKV